MLLPALALCLVVSAPSPAEQRYLSTRDRYVARFSEQASMEFTNEEERALEELARLLHAAIGPVKLAGLSDPGRINLEVLHPEMGFGRVDGLRFEWSGDTLVVTTRPLLEAYLASSSRRPLDVAALATDPSFLFNAFSVNVALDPFTPLPVVRGGGADVAAASLVLSTQDDGPYPPNTLVVVAARGERVFAVASDLKPALAQIPECQAEWARVDAASPPSASAQLPRPAYAAYRACYVRALRDRPAFAELTRRAQAVIDRLGAERAPSRNAR